MSPVISRQTSLQCFLAVYRVTSYDVELFVAAAAEVSEWHSWLLGEHFVFVSSMRNQLSAECVLISPHLAACLPACRPDWAQL